MSAHIIYPQPPMQLPTADPWFHEAGWNPDSSKFTSSPEFRNFLIRSCLWSFQSTISECILRSSMESREFSRSNASVVR